MNKNEKKNSTDNFKINKKYKNRVSRNPIILLQKIFNNLHEKNAFKSKRFWLTNIFIFFICLKGYQLSRYMNEFSYFIPKEELNRQNMRFNHKQLSQMDKKELFDFLDKLDKKKIERKSSKDNDFQRNVIMYSNNINNKINSTDTSSNSTRMQ